MSALPPAIDGQPPHWNVYFNVGSTVATVPRDQQGAMFCAMQNPDD